MHELLNAELKKRGWLPGSYRGFLRQLRGGIEWEVGVGRSGRLELRWRYRTENGERTGDEVLPENAGLAEIEDTMTSIYLRVHERPDPTRIFGNAGKRQRSRSGSSVTEATSTTPPEEAGQGAFDL